MSIDNTISKQIWQDRYQKNKESYEDNLKRVSNFCSNNEKERQSFYDLMAKKLFFPAGRTMSNAGLGSALTLNNCFTLNFVNDSIEEIFETVKNAAKTHQRGGGTGFEFSKVRPNGTPTSNDAIASGVISFLNVFDAQTKTINQGSRRGANMSVLSIYHPDIYDYIDAKSYDEGKLTHFNLSIMIDDDFMEAVKANKTIDLHYPVYDDDGFYIKDESLWTHKKNVNARNLWNLIIQKAYDTGELGVLFYDNMNKDNNVWYLENIVNTNPCFTGDMKLLTSNGYEDFKSLDGQCVDIVNINGDISNGKVWKTGEKDTIILRLSTGKEIKCTPNHVFLTTDLEEVEAIDLKGKKIMPYHKRHKKFNDEYIRYGFIQGDGSLTRLNSKRHLGLEVHIGKNDLDIKKLFNVEDYDGRSFYLDGFNEILKSLGFSSERLPNREFPTTYDDWSILNKASFLQGCYSANGSVIKNHRVSYKTTSIEFAKKLTETLYEDFSIESYITTNKSKDVDFKNGKYRCKESYDVNIGRYDSIQIFSNEIGFYHQYKKDSLEELLIYKSPKVTKIIPNGVESVYDFNEPLEHWGVIEGFIAHNCAEYLAGVVFKDETTKKYKGACNLGSIFLHNLIENPFTSQASINKDLLKNTISNAIKLLDNIIDKNRFPLKDYEDYQKNLRTIGLGYTGLANMSAMMGYKYGSKEHIEWIDEILNVIAYESYMTSIELAKEKGSFNLLDKEKFIQSGFIQKHLKKYPEWQNVIDGIKKHGIRNARLLSVAPTGTLSLTYGENCSSGVEPVFALSTKRIVKIGGQEDVNAQEVEFNDYGYDLWKSIKGEKISNEVFVTAQDLSVEDHIEVLKVVAFHTDMSVSKTINIPTEYSFEQTKGVYFKCWESGIKGCTIFRPNEIRKGIFITDDQTKQNEDELGYTHQDLPRGMIYEVDDDLIGKKEKIVSGCGNMHLQAWFDPQTGQLMEVFLAKGANGICNSFMTSLSRQISLNLRGGVPIEAVVDQLKSTPTCPSYSVRSATKRDTSKGSSCPSAIGNIIEKMQREVYEELGIGDDEDYEIKIKPVPKKEIAHVIKDKTDKEKFLDENGEIAFAMRYKECPQCHNELDQGDGCYSCHDCGWTKC